MSNGTVERLTPEREGSMSIYQGKHVIAEFAGASAKAVVLEVRSKEALLQ